MFVDMVRQGGKAVTQSAKDASTDSSLSIRQPNIPADLPVFGPVHPCA